VAAARPARAIENGARVDAARRSGPSYLSATCMTGAFDPSPSTRLCAEHTEPLTIDRLHRRTAMRFAMAVAEQDLRLCECLAEPRYLSFCASHR
jgi:hypothetical protein